MKPEKPLPWRPVFYGAALIVGITTLVGYLHLESVLIDDAIEKEARPQRTAAMFHYTQRFHLTHPLRDCTWISQTGPNERQRRRCTPLADLTRERK